MERITRLCIAFGFILFLVTPIFAQEGGIEDVGLPESEEALTATDETAGEGVVTGEVAAVDVKAGTVTIKTEDGAEKAFSVVEGETILWKGIEDIELSNVTKGDKAEVGYYTDENGRLIASWIDVLIEEEVAPVEAGVAEEEEILEE